MMLRLFNYIWSNFFEKILRFEMVAGTSTSGDVEIIESWEVLIAAALDESYNHKLQESHWYGLWDDVLQYFRRGSILHCFVYPQYTLVKLVNDDDLGSDYDPRSDARGSDSFALEDIELDEIMKENLQIEPVTPPSSPHSSAMDENPLTRGQSDGPSPLQVSSQSESLASSPAAKMWGRRKIPDFGVGCYLNCKRKQGVDGTRPNILLERRFIPILVEVKSYVWVNKSHDHQRSKDDLTNKLIEACDDLLIQAKFFFSPMSIETKQSAVIAIAASGMFWCWIQLRNVNGKPVPNMDTNPSGTSKPDNVSPPSWSKRYEIGTKVSKDMLHRIREWMEELALRPGPLVNNPRIIKEP